MKVDKIAGQIKQYGKIYAEIRVVDDEGEYTVKSRVPIIGVARSRRQEKAIMLDCGTVDDEPMSGLLLADMLSNVSSDSIAYARYKTTKEERNAGAEKGYVIPIEAVWIGLDDVSLYAVKEHTRFKTTHSTETDMLDIPIAGMASQSVDEDYNDINDDITSVEPPADLFDAALPDIEETNNGLYDDDNDYEDGDDESVAASLITDTSDIDELDMELLRQVLDDDDDMDSGNQAYNVSDDDDDDDVDYDDDGVRRVDEHLEDIENDDVDYDDDDNSIIDDDEEDVQQANDETFVDSNYADDFEQDLDFDDDDQFDDVFDDNEQPDDDNIEDASTEEYEDARDEDSEEEFDLDLDDEMITDDFGNEQASVGDQEQRDSAEYDISDELLAANMINDDEPSEQGDVTQNRPKKRLRIKKELIDANAEADKAIAANENALNVMGEDEFDIVAEDNTENNSIESGTFDDEFDEFNIDITDNNQSEYGSFEQAFPETASDDAEQQKLPNVNNGYDLDFELRAPIPNAVPNLNDNAGMKANAGIVNQNAQYAMERKETYTGNSINANEGAVNRFDENPFESANNNANIGNVKARGAASRWM